MRAKTVSLVIIIALAALALAVWQDRASRRTVDEPPPPVSGVELTDDDGAVTDAPAFSPDDDRASLGEREALPQQSPDGLYRDLDDAFGRIPRAADLDTDDDAPLATELPELERPEPGETDEDEPPP